jgi:anti-sigma factor RsiW
MECRSCFDALTAFMDQELSPGDRQSVEDHLNHCPSCREEYDSLLESYELTTKLSWVEPDARVWAGIRSQLAVGALNNPVQGPMAHRKLVEVLVSWIMRPWLPISALAGILGFVLLVNYLDPPNPVESEFSHFIQERERIYDSQRKILFTHGQWQLREERNPFSQPASFSDKNPFQE